MFTFCIFSIISFLFFSFFSPKLSPAEVYTALAETNLSAATIAAAMDAADAILFSFDLMPNLGKDASMPLFHLLSF